jgi:hypothetical protein
MPDLMARVIALDEDDEFRPDDDVDRFIEVLAEITSTGTPADISELPLVVATEADALVERARLLSRLRAEHPALVAGPLRADQQYFVGTASMPPPSARLFLAADAADAAERQPAPASTKPFDLGLFTSTGDGAGYGMWRRYLEINRGSTLFPLPWRTWSLRVAENLTVREITSAVDWTAFVLEHPRRQGPLLYPDWAAAARDYDAVHMTLSAIAATQGLLLATAAGPVAAPYWDVESTLWLRWRFTGATLVETAR